MSKKERWFFWVSIICLLLASIIFVTSSISFHKALKGNNRDRVMINLDMLDAISTENTYDGKSGETVYILP